MRSRWRALLLGLRERSRRWSRRRQGTDPLRLRLDSQRIYILPTGAGLLFAVMLATMLLGAMNYNNNLGFAVTFLLASMGTLTIYHCHRTLAGLRVHCLGAAPVFAGDTAAVRFALHNDSRQAREEIRFGWDLQEPPATALAPRETRLVSLALATRRRGMLPLPALQVSTCAPLGLVRAWTWIHLDNPALVYPRPSTTGDARPPGGADRRAGTDPRHGEDDFAGLRPFRPGDPPRRLAWKAYARSGELLVRELRGGAIDPLWIDWHQVAGSDAEQRISRMTRAVLDAHREGRAWGLRLPQASIGPARGAAHLGRCLGSLATFEPPTRTSAA